MPPKKRATKRRVPTPKASPIDGDKLRAMLEALELTQEAFAIRAGMKLNTVSKIVRGVVDPQVSTFVQLVDALGCDADALLRRSRKSN